MFKQFVQNAQNLDQYLIFSMVVFMLFFIGVLTYIFLMKKETVETLSQLPLNDNDKKSNKPGHE